MAGNNTNIMHVGAIEGYAVQMSERLEKLYQESKNITEFNAVLEAQELLHLFQTNEIKNLREAFE